MQRQRADGQTGPTLNERPQNNVYHRSDCAALLFVSDGERYQQNVVHVVDHTLVKPNELAQLHFYPTCV